MQPYGNKKLTGYAELTGKPSCRCCNGKYARIGKNWRNRTRGLKKQTRRDSRVEADPSDNSDIERLILKCEIQQDEYNRETLNDYYAEEIKAEAKSVKKQ